MKSKVTIFGLSAALLGCAGGYRQPESIESKMERFKSKSAEINKVPEIQVLANVNYKKPTTRGPASASSNKTKKDMQSEHTNKKLYFLTLLSQYKQLSSYSSAEKVPAVDICPSFHSILVDHKEKFESEGFHRTSKVAIDFNKVYPPSLYKDSNQLSYYPELMLPMTKDDLHPTVAEYMNSNENANPGEVVASAINLHLVKTHDELKELCDSGTSNNYFIYENLMTHSKREGLGASEMNMKVLLRTSIFTNVALIKSFEKASKKTRGRSLASAEANQDTYTEAVVNRLGVDWSESYFDSMTSNR